ncbi:phospholipase/lecithinase/hemolysin [Legionella beliardensis]|uniref:Phospholipase/lecithinase/hemolysin n=1 Tax=Legionella beliardensis TaxID=91822 RepID=A0A378JRH2_9GAMM|nr:SGNH/GDSL hydrolase family protein [Legionella beliardensis]STX55791.1 phospholipase/lecithinase/hemolysin [Legionella beliardensis]
MIPPEKIKISHWVVMGDSLSDIGCTARRYLLGIIPLASFCILTKSPNGRFTDGFTWSEYFISSILYDSELTQPRVSPLLSRAIEFKPNLDKMIPEAEKISPLINSNNHNSITISTQFDDYPYLNYQGYEDFARIYAEGGTTSKDYTGRPSKSISRFFSRIILKNLNSLRKDLYHWDQSRNITPIQKSQTMIIEWTGANDLTTVNLIPTQKEAQQAVQARIKNIKKLIEQGYRHFVLFDLPDLSLTPRFQYKSKEDRAQAHACSEFFNTTLAKACQDLSEIYPYCSIGLHDVNKLLIKVFENPKFYGFEKSLRKESYTARKSPKPADSYIFWDDVHPSDHMHRLIANDFRQKIQSKYCFVSPAIIDKKTIEDPITVSEEQLLSSFQKKYLAKLNKDRHKFGLFRRSKIEPDKASLSEIFYHGLFGEGYRTCQTLKSLRWIDDKGNINLNSLALKKAWLQANSLAATKPSFFLSILNHPVTQLAAIFLLIGGVIALTIASFGLAGVIAGMSGIALGASVISGTGSILCGGAMLRSSFFNKEKVIANNGLNSTNLSTSYLGLAVS